ncbi:hypothetical protein B0H10DRAFT_1991676 [Mycena sp. CBHHK59/15]|nr:hypothetical protein B0H10DRAFT_1991676 [Mycena sp. CBHHK59/15]
MTQQSKVTRHIREEQYTDSLCQKREGRKNHSEVQIKTLLTVPRYADTNISDTDDNVAQNQESVLVSSRVAWRKQVAAWQSDMRDAVSDSDNDDAQAASSTGAHRRTNWLPIQLDKLFGSNLKEPIHIRPSCTVVSEEVLYMQLLAAEHSGEEPDDGELEGSGDDYTG